MTLRFYEGENIRTGEAFIYLGGHGRIYISSALTQEVPPGTRRLKVGWDPDARMLVLLPVPLNDTGGALIKLDKGGMATTARQALLFLGVPQVKDRIPAVWRSGRIEAILPGNGDAAPPKPEATSRRPAAAKLATPLPPAFVDDGHPEEHSNVPRCCKNCSGQSFHLCMRQSSRNANLRVQPDWVCGEHTFKGEKRITPPRRGRTKPDQTKASPPRERHHSRQRGRCSVSDHGGRLYAVSGKGIYPHDVTGVAYTAGAGDPKRKCPGSNKPPAEE